MIQSSSDVSDVHHKPAVNLCEAEVYILDLNVDDSRTRKKVIEHECSLKGFKVAGIDIYLTSNRVAIYLNEKGIQLQQEYMKNYFEKIKELSSQSSHLFAPSMNVSSWKKQKMCIVASTKAFSWSNNHPLTLGTYTDDVSKNIKMQWNDWKKKCWCRLAQRVYGREKEVTQFR